jgi:putative transposase
LNVQGMMKNHNLARAIGDASPYEIRRQLGYKVEWNGGTLQPISRFYPSTQLCRVCKFQNKALTLSDRVWTCPRCSTVHHRDFNASVNIREEAERLFNAGSGYVGETPVEGIALAPRKRRCETNPAKQVLSISER